METLAAGRVMQAEETWHDEEKKQESINGTI